MAQTDFRPKDMSPRRSRMLDSIEDPTENRSRSLLPKALVAIESTRQEDNARDMREIQRTLAVSKRVSVFSTMMANRANKTYKECNLANIASGGPASQPKRVMFTSPDSPSQFRRVNVPSITGVGSQIWRRVNSTVENSYSAKIPQLRLNSYGRSPSPTPMMLKVPTLPQ